MLLHLGAIFLGGMLAGAFRMVAARNARAMSRLPQKASMLTLRALVVAELGRNFDTPLSSP